MGRMKTYFGILLAVATMLSTRAQSPTDGQSWRYLLLEGAAIMDDCSSCDRLTFWQPLHGSFDLKGTETVQLFEIQNIRFVSDYSDKPAYVVTGGGTLDFQSGEPVLTVEMSVLRGGFVETARLTNVLSDSPRIFPILGAEASAPLAAGHFYRLRLFAAPIRELWFSTAVDFTRGTPGIPEEAQISNGDFLSNSGRVVKRNARLTERLSIPPGDVGLDAVDIGPRGEIFFSIATDTESIASGPLSNGDIVTSEGRLYLQNSQLLSPFGVTDSDPGLDALHIVSEDEVYFSIAKSVTRTGGKLSAGDILSSKGRIVRTEANLLLHFINPLTTSVGVDALYVWPNGEIWFSTQLGFTNANASVSAGDILSDQGYVALRNSDITAAFTPIANVSDLGLDAITLISDAAASRANCQITGIDLADKGVDIRWESLGRVFQLERASAITGPFTPITDIIIERHAQDVPPNATAFYRVRQW
jgi:hypothetical protein